MEVQISREHSINALFEALSRNGIEVISLRNKQNRLEKLFLDMVDRAAERPHDARARSLACATGSPSRRC
jgi:hypothetical protein